MHIGTDKDYAIQRISREKIADLGELYSTVYSGTHPRDHYLHKYATGYTGIEYAGFIAYTTAGRPIASLCLVPCFISYEGRRILAAQLTDGMTDPAFRKNGLFGRLEEQVVTFAKENGIQFIFGFPNQDAYPLLSKKGWVTTEIMDRFMIKVPRTIQWAINSFMQRELNMMMPGIDQEGCLNSVFANGFAGVERSQEYFQYKSYTHSKVLMNDGDKAWIAIGKHSKAIGDMEVTENGFDAMMDKILEIAEQTAVQKLFFQSSKGTWLHELFSKRYKAEPSFHVIFKMLGEGVEPEKIKFTFADIDIF